MIPLHANDDLPPANTALLNQATNCIAYGIVVRWCKLCSSNATVADLTKRASPAKINPDYVAANAAFEQVQAFIAEIDATTQNMLDLYARCARFGADYTEGKVDLAKAAREKLPTFMRQVQG